MNVKSDFNKIFEAVRDAQIIVAINRDEAANIFELSDYGVVGDLYRVLPALTKILKEKAR